MSIVLLYILFLLHPVALDVFCCTLCVVLCCFLADDVYYEHILNRDKVRKKILEVINHNYLINNYLNKIDF